MTGFTKPRDFPAQGRHRCHPHHQALACSGAGPTKTAIEDAFVQLVLERGYERIAVEDISDRADLARAIFYAHFPNKEAVLFLVSNRLVEDLMQRIAYQGGPWNVVRRDAIQTAYKHAAEQPDLYRACMSDARTRQAYLSVLSRYAEQNSALGRVPPRCAWMLDRPRKRCPDCG